MQSEFRLIVFNSNDRNNSKYMFIIKSVYSSFMSINKRLWMWWTSWTAKWI